MRSKIVSIQHQILRARAVSKSEFKTHFQGFPNLADFRSPHLIADLIPAARRVVQAIKGSERIAVFGDYDCDGISSAAILIRFLRVYGLESSPFLASRSLGYGLSQVQDIIASHPDLVLICDTGTSDEPEIQALKDAGISSVVIDHHTVPRDPVSHPADYLINPKRLDSEHPFTGLCSAALSWTLCWQVTKLMGKGVPRSLLPLAALGQVVDVGEMRHEGRLIVRLGLLELASQGESCFDALVQRMNPSKTGPIDARDLGWSIGPAINAAGRIADPRLALDLFISRSPLERGHLADRLVETNLRRRELSSAGTDEAIENVQISDDLVFSAGSWMPGVSGIIASRLVERFDRPAFILSLESGSGSARGTADCGVYDILESVSDRLGRWGGHQAAAGFSIPENGLEDLADALLAWRVDESIQPAGWAGLDSPIELDPGDIDLTLIRAIEGMGPYGVGFSEPTFKVRAKIARYSRMGDRRQHSRIEMTSGLQAVFWNGGERLADMRLRKGRDVVLIGRLEIGTWKGIYPQMVLDDLSLADEPG